jgi:acetyl esterase/lipase
VSEPWVLTEPSPPGTKESYGSAPSQHVVIRRPPGTTRLPTLVMIHGGYWRAAYDAGHAGHLCADLASRGWATVALEYRRIGEPGGGWPGTLTDVTAALDALPGLAERHGLDLSRAVWMGHSAGGHLAAALKRRGAATLPVREICMHTLPTSAPVRLDSRPAQAQQPRHARAPRGTRRSSRRAMRSPAAHLPLGVRTVVIHGTKDNVVPLAMNRGFVDQARKAGDSMQLETPEDVDHFDVIDPKSRIWPRIVELLAIR